MRNVIWEPSLSSFLGHVAMYGVAVVDVSMEVME